MNRLNYQIMCIVRLMYIIVPFSKFYFIPIENQAVKVAIIRNVGPRPTHMACQSLFIWFLCSHATGYSNSQVLNQAESGRGQLDLKSIHLSIRASVPPCIVQSHFPFFHLLHFQPPWCAFQWCSYKQCGAPLLHLLTCSH